jgi:hypothetical protein
VATEIVRVDKKGHVKKILDIKENDVYLLNFKKL